MFDISYHHCLRTVSSIEGFIKDEIIYVNYMATDREEFARIKEVLKKNPKGMNVIEIAAAIDMHRQSVTKYLEMLTVAGQVEVKTFGPSKVYYLSQRLPLSAMLSISSDMILLLDRDMKIINANESFLARMNAAREDILNKVIGTVYFPIEFQPSIIPYIADAILGKESRIEAVYKKKGKEQFFAVKFLPVVFDDGQPGATVIIEDVTGQRKAEQERERILARLKESDLRFRSLLQNLKSAVALVESDGQFSVYNQSFLEMFGFADEDMERLTIMSPEWTGLVVIDQDGSVLPPEKRPSICAFRTGTPVKNMLVGFRRVSDRRLIWALAAADPIWTPDGRLDKLTCTFHEITERKEAEEQLAAANSQLELYLDLLDHDISNAHQVALGQLELARELMEEEGKLEGEDLELIETPIEALRRSARLIDTVRKLQLLTAGDYRADRIDLGRLLAEVVGEHNSIPGAGPAVTLTPPAPGCVVRANPLLKDVFTNLLGYAIKHAGGSAIRIGLGKVETGGASYYRVKIEDDGPGIPDEKKAEAFRLSMQGYTKAKTPGLSQYIVKTLVEGFNGRVSVEDRVPGDYARGARLVVDLPVAEGKHGIQ